MVVWGAENFKAFEIKLSRICKVAAGSALAQSPSEAPMRISIAFFAAII
jgi:hypothetical protein